MDFDLIQGIINALAADSRITALIGVPPNMRIASLVQPQGVDFPYVVIGKAGRGKVTYYLGAVNVDRDSMVSVIFIGRNDFATSQGDVVHLDQWAFEALTPNKVVAPNLVTFLRFGDAQENATGEYTQGTAEYFSCGGIYEAHFQLS